jgi:hypothetical protein
MDVDEIASGLLGIGVAPIVKGQLNALMAPLNLDSITPGLHKAVQGLAEAGVAVALLHFGKNNQMARDLGWGFAGLSAATVLDPLMPSARYAPISAPSSAATSARVFSVPIGSVIS